MVRKILAVVIGAAIAIGLISGIEFLGHQVYPMPQDLNPGDADTTAAYVRSLPLGSFAFIIGAWTIATLVGGWTAAKISGELPHLFAGIVGALVLMGSIMTLVMIPHPLWFSITAVVLIVLMAFIAGRLAAR